MELQKLKELAKSKPVDCLQMRKDLIDFKNSAFHSLELCLVDEFFRDLEEFMKRIERNLGDSK